MHAQRKEQAMSGGLFDLTGKVALVTGAGAGIGRAIALGFAGQGADLLVCDIDDAGLAETVRRIEATGRRGFGIHTNVASADDRAALLAELDARFGHIDILVNNVGTLRRARPEDQPIEDLEYVLESGLLASFAIAQGVAKRMIAAGRGGSIIQISSIAGITALGRGNWTHSVNKGGIHQLTKELAVEWARYGIRVNAILPCQVRTESFVAALEAGALDPAIQQRMIDGIPMGRMATPEEMAGPAIFLASDAAAMVTGTLLPVDGGNLAMNAGGSRVW
jgi:NAD(P)-dependent dehydrogenase (short-subunit alcohol dehydrogenase family)